MDSRFKAIKLLLNHKNDVDDGFIIEGLETVMKDFPTISKKYNYDTIKLLSISCGLDFDDIVETLEEELRDNDIEPNYDNELYKIWYDNNVLQKPTPGVKKGFLC